MLHLTAALLFALTMQSTAPAVEHYKLRLTIDPKSRSLVAEADLGIRNSADRAITVVPVLLYRLMDVDAAMDGQGKPLSFSQRVVKFPDEPLWQVNAIEVTLAEPLAPGQTATVRLKYGGSLFGYAEVMAYVRDTISEQYSLLRAETMAYPIVAWPSIAGWRQAHKNKFDYDIETTVPADFAAVCSGSQIGELKRGMANRLSAAPGSRAARRSAWPLPGFGYSDAGGTLRVYALPSVAEAGTQVMAEMRRSLDFFRSYFGEMQRG